MNKPALFAKSNGVTRNVIECLSDEFDDEICRMSGRCIDIGSGPGDAISDFILPKLNAAATIVCSDVSEEMVEFGKDEHKNNRRMSFIQLDIETPRLPDDLVGQFDHVTSFYCVNWCRDMRQVFENILTLLRPGGNALISFLVNSPALDGYYDLAAMPLYQPYMQDAARHVPVYQRAAKPRETLKKLIRDVGFEVQHCSVRENSWIFNSRKTFMDLIVAVNPFVDRMPADVRVEYEKDLYRESARRNVLLNEDTKNEDEYKLMFLHKYFVLYLKKPLYQ